MHNKSKKKLTFNVVVYILVIVCTILSLFPTFFAFLLAVLKEKNANAMYDDVMQIFSGFTFENFINVLQGSNIPRWTLNSFIVAIVQTVLYVFIASLAAFGFSRLKFKGRKVLFDICLFSMLVPGIINCVPNYIIISSMGLYDSLFAMILPGLSGVGGVFLLKQFMDNIPKDYD